MSVQSPIIWGIPVQAGPIGAQPMTETRISTAIIPVEHVVVRTKKPYIEVKAALETRLGRLDSDILSLLRETKSTNLELPWRSSPAETGSPSTTWPRTAIG